MNVLQHKRNELNLCLQQNRPDRSYRGTLSIPVVNFVLAYQPQLKENFSNDFNRKNDKADSFSI